MFLGQLSYVKGNWSVTQTQIGNFDVSKLASVLNQLFKDGIVPLVNIVLKYGIEIPTVKGMMIDVIESCLLTLSVGVTFVNPTVSWHAGYLMVSTDVKYVPPAFFDAPEIDPQPVPLLVVN
jgi:hypothetical protein